MRVAGWTPMYPMQVIWRPKSMKSAIGKAKGKEFFKRAWDNTRWGHDGRVSFPCPRKCMVGISREGGAHGRAPLRYSRRGPKLAPRYRGWCCAISNSA